LWKYKGDHVVNMCLLQVKAANAARERCIVEKRDGLRSKIRSVNPQTRIAMHGLLCDFIDQVS
jgi:hypothetical protein